MEKVGKIAAYIYHQYKERFGDTIDEMKLHKLLYFGQRESFVLYNEPLFEGTFHAGQYGPVVLEVRELYRSKKMTEMPEKTIIDEKKEVFEKLWCDYAIKSSWSLSSLSHGEISWKNAYEKNKTTQLPYQKMEDKDILKDALKIKRRRERMNQP